MVMAMVAHCCEGWRRGREQHDSKKGKGDFLHAVIHILPVCGSKIANHAPRTTSARAR
jgi:hypothetical protein